MRRKHFDQHYFLIILRTVYIGHFYIVRCLVLQHLCLLRHHVDDWVFPNQTHVLIVVDNVLDLWCISSTFNYLSELLKFITLLFPLFFITGPFFPSQFGPKFDLGKGYFRFQNSSESGRAKMRFRTLLEAGIQRFVLENVTEKSDPFFSLRGDISPLCRKLYLGSLSSSSQPPSPISMVEIRFSVQQWFLRLSFVSLAVTLSVSACLSWYSLERPGRKLVLLYFVFKENKRYKGLCFPGTFSFIFLRCIKFTICNFCNILFSMPDNWLVFGIARKGVSLCGYYNAVLCSLQQGRSLV